MGTLITTTSAVMGPNTRIQIRKGYDLMPNIYAIIVGDTGTGKTPIFKRFCSSVVSAIEATEGIAKFRINEFTRAGLLKSLNNQRGFGFISSDEFCSKFSELFKERNRESAAFPANLNEFWSGEGGQKVFASKSKLDWPETYLTILGLTQPDTFCEILPTSRRHRP